MTPRTRPRRSTSASATSSSPYPDAGLAQLGLAPGDVVRFRRREGERWKQGVVARREKDGSVGLHDGRGAARSIGIDLLEVRTEGPRGGTLWEPLSERAARTEQMPLVRDAPRPRGHAARGPHRPVEERPPPEPTDAQPGTEEAGTEAPGTGTAGSEQLRLL